MLRRTLLVLIIWSAGLAQEPVDQNVNARIRQEAYQNSRIMSTIHYLTDVFGARLTGSPQLRAAGEWAMLQMADWGLENAHMEAWDFGREGWTNERATALLTSPVKDTLVARAIAWTPSTEGALTAACAWIVPPEAPTAEEMRAWLAAQKEIVSGRIVLVGKHALTNAESPVTPAPPGRLTPQQVSEQVDRFLRENGAAARIDDAARPFGQVRGFHNRTYDPLLAVPQLVVRNEDYGRVTRLLAEGAAVEMEVHATNQAHAEGRTQYNVFAEIPGTDRRDEVVMVGGHLDSWHMATGATDNASGVAVAMEAARILKAIGVRPRRTIRVALWSGEEQGLLGSQAYVRDHYGTAELPRPEFAGLAAYFNIDNGTGRIYGLSVFGPQEAATILSQIATPFRAEGVQGAMASNSRRLGGSDHSSFAAAGLPGVAIGEDPRDYLTATWHTNLDTYERIYDDDLKQAALVVASMAYHVAMREQMLPRFASWQMPRPGN